MVTEKRVATPTVTREAVLSAACELFAERGFRGTSMKDIAAKLAVRAPSLYNHVSSKHDILITIMERALVRAYTDLEASLEGIEEPHEQLREATISLVLDFLNHPDEVTVSNNELRVLEGKDRDVIIGLRRRHGQRFREIIERGHSKGVFAEMAPQLASYTILEMGSSAKAWFRPGGELSALEVARIYGEFALRIVDFRG